MPAEEENKEISDSTKKGGTREATVEESKEEQKREFKDSRPM